MYKQKKHKRCVSTTNLSDVYPSSPWGLFRNKGWIHHRDQSRHAIVERRHEGLNRLDHLSRKSPPQNRCRHTKKRLNLSNKKTTWLKRKNNNKGLFGLVYFHPSSSQKNRFNQKKPGTWNLTSWKRESWQIISGCSNHLRIRCFERSPKLRRRPQACTSQRWANLPCSTGKSQLLRLGKTIFFWWIFVAWFFLNQLL